jgi:MFS family permease
VRPPVAVLGAAFLFNLGQGVLRPALPLYLQHAFAANYRMVTLIPVVFGAGKWLASLPTGYLLDRVGRTPLMVAGLLLLASIDLASAVTSVYGAFLALRGLGGVGWAMFGTVALTTVVDRPGGRRRGRAVSVLLICESLGLLLGTGAGGVLYASAGAASPFLFEAACMTLAAVAVAWPAAAPAAPRPAPGATRPDRALVRGVLAVPGVWVMSLTSGLLTSIQTGIIVFLFPLHLAGHGRLGAEAVGYVVSATILGRLLALWWGGSLSDRRGRTAVLVPGLLAYAALLGGLAFVSQPAALGIGSLAMGAAAGVVAAIPAAAIGDRVPAPLQGPAIGWLRTVTDTGMIVGPLVFGAVADLIHLSAPFLLAAALLAVLAWHAHRTAGPDVPPTSEA